MPDNDHDGGIVNPWHTFPKGERAKCTSDNFWRDHGERCACTCFWCIEHKNEPEAGGGCCPSLHD